MWCCGVLQAAPTYWILIVWLEDSSGAEESSEGTDEAADERPEFEVRHYQLAMSSYILLSWYWTFTVSRSKQLQQIFISQQQVKQDIASHTI
jgi:hypothetical protein